MKVLVVCPKEPPVLRDVKPGLKPLQDIVGGYIEAIYPFDDPVAIICNEEGKLNSLEMNRALCDSDGNVYDIIYGTFIIAGLAKNDFGSLSKELAEKYANMFRKPEMFIKRPNGKILVLR